MSGILKSIGKIFKPIVKVLKKIALPALAIGAIVLTGGAAIGALPALSTMIGGLGLSAGVTAALTSAVSTAAIGAVGGGLSAAISGKNVLSGMGTGAGIGFATGGILGAAGIMGGGASGGAGAATGATGTIPPGFGVAGAGDVAASGMAGAAGIPADFGAGAFDAATSALPAGVTSAIPTAAAPVIAAAPSGAAAATAATGAGHGLLASITNPMVLGPVIKGIGGGIAQASVAKDQRQALIDERNAISGNYKTGILSSAGRISYDPGRPTPTQRFDPRTYGGQYQFDPAQGRVVFVPNPAPAG